MRTPSPPECGLDLVPPLADRFLMGVAPLASGPVLRRMPLGFPLAGDTDNDQDFSAILEHLESATKDVSFLVSILYVRATIVSFCVSFLERRPPSTDLRPH